MFCGTFSKVQGKIEFYSLFYSQLNSKKMNPANMEQEMDYQFVCKFIQVLKKINKAQGNTVDLMYHISNNPLMTMTYVNKHPDESWSWCGLTCNTAMSLAYIEAHPEKPWCPDEYDYRKSSGDWIPHMLRYCEIDAKAEPPCEFWNAANVMPADIEKHMPWIDATVARGNYAYAEAYAEAQAYTEIQADALAYADAEAEEGRVTWKQLSENPNLTLDFIDRYYKKPWSLPHLLHNPLPAAKTQFIKEYKAAYTIQQAYARAKYIPSYAYCRKLHLQFYESMYNVA
jgi:hypothetical protein